ncbi:MAG: hypothetical protein HS113_21085 [Verrucomicrobiales bacterium]|nr:hypothetical protein [Verrucomicrobiales bacterium]
MAKPRIEIELTTKGASAVQKTLSGVLSSVKSWVGGLGAVVGAAFSVRELTRGLQEAVTALDAAGAAAQKAGVGVKELSTLGYAATISKANVEQLQVGLRFLNRSIFEAAKGAKEYSEAYNQLGVSVRNEDGSLRSTSEVMLDIANRFAEMPNGAQKTALAMQLLGKSGSELIPFLNQGAAAIRGLQEEARVFGVEVTPQAAQAAGDFNDNLQRLQYAARGMFQQIAAELLPALVALTDRIVALAKSSEALGVVGRALSAVLKEVAWFLVGAAEAVKVLATAFDILTDYLSVPLFALGRFAGALQDLAGIVVSSVGEMLRQFEALGNIMAAVFARQFGVAARLAETALKDLTVSAAKATADIAGGVARVVGTVGETADYAAEVQIKAARKWTEALDVAGTAMIRFEWEMDNAMPPAAALDAGAFEPGEFDSTVVLRQRTKLELEAQAQTLADRRLELTTSIARLETDRFTSDTERFRQTLAWKREELALVEEHIRRLKERLELEQDEQTRQLLIQQIRQAEREQAGLGTDIAKQRSQGDPASIRDQLMVAADDMARRIGTLAQQIARSFTSVVGSAIDGIAESMSGLIRGTMDWADALRNVAQTMGTAVVNAISRMFAEWLVGRAMMAVKNILFSQQEGAADAAAKAPGALMSSISSYGVAALVGTAALFAAVAAMSGAFAQGGVVRGPGGPKEDRVLARLSPGEYVIPAERVSQYGTEFFERIRQGQDVINFALARASAAAGRVNVAGLRDYGQPALQAVEGQMRQITAETALLDAVTGGSRDAAPASSPVDPSKVNLSLVLVDSRNQARQFLESAEGEARLVEIIRKRRMQVGIPT